MNKLKIKKVGFKEIKIEAFQRDNLNWKLNLIHSVLRKTRFYLMSYPQIKVEGMK